jgi:probable phosphomutase (TIGR03848 family)
MSAAPAPSASARPPRVSRRRRASAPPSTQILLVRHAVTAHTGPILSGRLPGIDLSDLGRQQAEAVADRLAPVAISTVYASPIERTMQTAGAIAGRHGLKVKKLPGMIEADYGEWTGGKLVDLAKTPLWRVVQSTPSIARFPGGESIREMQGRAVTAIEKVVVAHPGETVVIVSHSDVIKAAAAHFTGMHLDLFQRLVVSPASVTALAFAHGGVALLALNQLGDLCELLPALPSADGKGPRGRRG